MNYIKRRSIPNLSNQIDRTQRANTRSKDSYTPKEGEHDYFSPRTDQPLWFAICPTQQWTTRIYDRDERQVVELENYLYYAYVQHTVSLGGNRFNRFICSAGADKNTPCWGCGVRNAFFAARDAEKLRTGVESKKECAINAGDKYAFAGVLLEHVARIHKKDQDSGKPIVKRDGSPLMVDEPLVVIANRDVEEARRLKAEGATTFGRSVHYSIGQEVLGQIKDFNERLLNYCANCAGKLWATQMQCPTCETVHEPMHPKLEEGLPLTESALTTVRGQKLKCPCGYHGPMQPMVECECDNPLEGTLTDFALHLIATKPTPKRTILDFDEVRTLKYFTEKYPAVQELLNKPLDLKEIFAPTKLSWQTSRIPETLRGDGVTPVARRKQNAEAFTESYALGGTGNAPEGKAKAQADADEFEA